MISTKVARIISPTKVVLAAGADHGVREGMEFIIYELSDLILDPETQESLGQLELVKGRVQVFHVQDAISMAETIPQAVRRSGALKVGIIDLIESIYPKLPVNEGDLSPLPTDPKVRIGDLVHSVAKPALLTSDCIAF